MKLSYGKEEKLKSKKLIKNLFLKGIFVHSHPLKLIFLKQKHNSPYPIQAGISVPKTKINKAANRNRIKRLMRETYRQNKQLFYDVTNKPYICMFLYTGRKECQQKDLEGKMKKLASQFSNITTKI